MGIPTRNPHFDINLLKISYKFVPAEPYSIKSRLITYKDCLRYEYQPANAVAKRAWILRLLFERIKYWGKQSRKNLLKAILSRDR